MRIRKTLNCCEFSRFELYLESGSDTLVFTEKFQKKKKIGAEKLVFLLSKVLIILNGIRNTEQKAKQ